MPCDISFRFAQYRRMAINMEKRFGTLVVVTRTARGAIPVEGVLVTVTADQSEYSGVVASRKSDVNGITEKIILPAPPKDNTQSPDSGSPCSIWNIDSDINGYYPVRNVGAQIYDGVTTVQAIDLIPIALGTKTPPASAEEILIDESKLPNL